MCFNSRTVGVTGLAAALLLLSPSVRADGANAKDATNPGKSSISLLPQSRLRIADSEVSNELATTSGKVLFTESDLGLSVQAHDRTGQQKAVNRFAGRHPAIGDAGSGNMLLAFETDDNDRSIEWWGTADGGASWVMSEDLGWEQTYPSIDYWGSGTRFHASFTPVGAEEQNRVYWLDIDDPMNASLWVMHDASWSGLGPILYTDMACNNSLEPERFGIIGFVAELDGRSAVPCMVFQNSDFSASRLSYFTSVDDCRSVASDIDPVALMTYVAYEWFDASVGCSKLLIRRNAYSDIANSTVAFSVGWDADLHVQEPSVAANNDTVVVVFQFQDDTRSDPTDRDIVCWTFGNGIENTSTASWVVNTGLSERHPQVVHLRDNTFLCSYIAEDTLFTCESTDGGITWSTPERLSAENDRVVDQYRTVDLMNPSGAATYEFMVEGDPVSYVRVGNAPCVDADGDFVCDDIDNCDARYNPNQEDIDSDGIGDSCDVISIAFEADTLFGSPPFAVSFTDLSFGISPISEWLWDFGDEETSTDQNPAHEYVDEGIYSVTLIASDGTSSDTLEQPAMISVSSLAFDIVDYSGQGVYQLRTADLDHDNETDLVWTSSWDDDLGVAYGDGTGSFNAPTYYDLNGYAGYFGAMAFGFLDSDPLIDVLVRSIYGLHILLNNGDRTFSTTTITMPSPEEVGAVDVGYFNGDQFLDVITGSGSFVGDGTGSLTSGLSTPPFWGVEVGDFNNDGVDDIVIAISNEIAIWTNDGNGNFSKAGSVATPAVTYSVSSAQGLADFDHDGNIDYAAVSYLAGCFITIVLGNGDGGIDWTQSIEVNGVAHNLVVTDANRDHELDLVISNTAAKGLEFYLGLGDGTFTSPLFVAWGVTDYIPHYVALALATGDFDRDGNPDFVTGDFSSERYNPIRVAYSLLPDAPVVESRYDMRAIGYDGLRVGIVNPDSFAISRDFRTVAGCGYFRFDADNNGAVDNQTIDYNLQYGEYELTATPVSDVAGGEVYNMAIGINGSQNRVLARNYICPYRARYRATNAPVDTFVFYFEVEEISSIQPPNGLATPNNRPAFDWSVRAVNDTVGPPYRFQLHRYHDFSVPPFMYDIEGLTSPQFTPESPLDPDSVYYWRFLSSSDNGQTYQDTSRTFAAYIVSGGCCIGRVGDANGEGEFPDEVTLGDIMLLVDVKFISGDCSKLACVAEADVNQDGGTDPTCEDHVTLGDIMTLVDFLFISNTPLKECL